MPLERQALQTIRRRTLQGMKGVAVEMTNRSKVLATRHNDNGTRRNSITQTIVGRHVLWGISLGAAPHAVYLERGFRPHWVPMRYMHLWARRHGVGQIRETANRRGQGRGRYGYQRKKTRGVKAVALGLYVGGPGSTLQSAPGGTYGYLFQGHGRRKRMHWRTRGGTSKYLTRGRVGHPILQPVAAHVKTFAKPAFLRAYHNAR